MNKSPIWLPDLILTVLMFGSQTALTAEVRHDPTSRPINKVLSEIHVVEARITAVKDLGKVSETTRFASVTAAVTVVYCGDGLQIGRRFEATTRDSPPWYSNLVTQVPSPTPHVGDVAIWQVYPKLDGSGFVGNRSDAVDEPLDGSLAADCFLGRDGTIRMAAAAAAPKVAQLFQNIADGKSETERLNILIERGKGGRYVSDAAVAILVGSTVPHRETAAHEFIADANVSISAKMRLDRALWQWTKPAWSSSSERKKVYLDSAEAARDSRDFADLAVAVNTAVEQEEFPVATAIEIVKLVNKNELFLTATAEIPGGQGIAWSMGQFTSSTTLPLDRDAAFMFFKDLFANTKEARLRMEALSGLKGLSECPLHLTDEQLERLKIIGNGVEDSEVHRLMKEILKDRKTGRP